MKLILIASVLIAGITLGSCNNRQEEQMDEVQDTGIRPERDYETSEGDTTRTDAINATGNANSGPVEGP